MKADCALGSAVRAGHLVALMSPGLGGAQTSSLTSLHQIPDEPGYRCWSGSTANGVRFQFGESMCAMAIHFLCNASGAEKRQAATHQFNPTVAGRAGCLA